VRIETLKTTKFFAVVFVVFKYVWLNQKNWFELCSIGIPLVGFINMPYFAGVEMLVNTKLPASDDPEGLPIPLSGYDRPRYLSGELNTLVGFVCHTLKNKSSRG